MATLFYEPPRIFLPEQVKSPEVLDAPAAAGHTTTAAIIVDGDILILTAGALSRAATNASANICGIAIHSEFATYGGGPNTGDPTGTLTLKALFGVSQVGTLLPSEPANVHYNPLQQIYLEINLSNTTGWVSGGSQQVTLGSTGGILYDATSNTYVFDPTQGNKPMTIKRKPAGPSKGGTGDLAARVLVQFTSGLV